MVNIYDLCDTTLGTLELPNYYGMPAFEGEEPETYLTYEETNRPHKFADGKRKSRDYNITVNIISPLVNSELLERVIAAFETSGFIYAGGAKIGRDNEYPYKIQHYQEFIITLEE